MIWFLSRVVRSVITLLLLVTFSFFALSAGGDPAVQRLGPEADPETLAAFRAAWGLDMPLWKQFLIYVEGLVRLDFGLSYRTGAPASALVADRLPATLSLMLPTAFLSVAIGVLLGLWAAMRQGRWTDRALMTVAVVSLAIPNFLVGLLLMYVFSVWLGWLPASGIDGWRSYVMPILTMATAEAAIFARFTRSAMVEVMTQPMIETARASGLHQRLILRAHVLPNVALPLLTVTGLFAGGMIGGAVVTENVFSWPGTGRLLVESVATRDYAVVQAIVLLIGACMIVANLLVDLAYGFTDPRIRDRRRKSSFPWAADRKKEATA